MLIGLVRGSLVFASSAGASLARHPLRSSLTAGGILVGVLAVTTVVSLGEGADRAVRAQVDQLGENLITVRPRTVEGRGRARRGAITDADVASLQREVGDAKHVVPVVEGLVRLMGGDRNTSAQAVGTTRDYLVARNYRLARGVFWDERADSVGQRVVVLGPTTARELFASADPVGSSVRIGRHLFSVIGLLEAKGQTTFGLDQDSICLMPLGTMRSKVTAQSRPEVSQVLLQARRDADLAGLRRAIDSLLRTRHGISPGEEDDFSVRDSASIQNAQQGIVDVMRLLLLSLAALSLIIAGIGVMNIMLVSVAERSREIGTRLAVGATGKDILVQFLIEAVVLCLLGGAVGAGATALLLPPLEADLGWTLVLSTRALTVALIVSFSSGVAFGLLPAARAARLDPVEALRSE